MNDSNVCYNVSVFDTTVLSDPEKAKTYRPEVFCTTSVDAALASVDETHYVIVSHVKCR